MSSSSKQLYDVCTSIKIYKLIQAFRSRGHFAASLDPLRSNLASRQTWLSSDSTKHPDIVRLLKQYPSSLDLKPFELQDIPLDTKFDICNEIKSDRNRLWSIKELVDFLSTIYCGNVGVEVAHIESEKERKWLYEMIENQYGNIGFSYATEEKQIESLKTIIRTNSTSSFLLNKFKTSKVFGLEGCEALIPALQSIVSSASTLGLTDVEIGLTHRGRMNILMNFFQKSLKVICSYFRESSDELGDVKYHLGTRAIIAVKGTDGVERNVSLSLSANPSHLESVNPVVIGKTKAKQFYLNDIEKTRIMPILLHGDAAFAGQGIVAEVLELSDLPAYSVGGCVHVIINNQIGFTTDPRLSRSSYHCTNVAKSIGAPIFHVNGDDIDAVVNVCRLAAVYRQTFKKDVVIDLVCYRRHGHNNLDDPSVYIPHTQQLIDAHPPVSEIYSRKLLANNVVSHEYITDFSAAINLEYQKEFEESKHYIKDPLEFLSSDWQGEALGSLISKRPYNQTGVSISTLNKIMKALISYPDDFVLHKDIQKLLNYRKKCLETGAGINMGTAEALALGALMTKFTPSNSDEVMNHKNLMKAHPTVHVRLSGQDSVRGTFNQRHSSIFCQKTNRAFVQLNNLNMGEQATISVANSSLSEEAILGFEYGYSLSNDTALTIWEAQFGDFANGAQSIIDCFIASGESKWNNKSSLVLLLPHGYEGQGPDHSSARLERFLQLIDDDEAQTPGHGITIRLSPFTFHSNHSYYFYQGTFSKAEMESGFDKLDKNKQGFVTLETFTNAIKSQSKEERVELTVTQILIELNDLGFLSTTDEGNPIFTKEAWCNLMTSWLQSNSERKHNMCIVVPSTPAQYFHCLRRQIHRPFNKPLVVMSGKWLLHHRACVSSLNDMTTGTFFQRVILERSLGDNLTHVIEDGVDNESIKKYELLKPSQIRRVIFCSGKIFYNLYHSRQGQSIRDITIIRVEQIAPFPYDLISPAIKKFPNAELVWCQEEPKNMGAWTYMKPRFDTAMRETGDINPRAIKYIGRKPSSASAVGNYHIHDQEQKNIIREALAL